MTKITPNLHRFPYDWRLSEATFTEDKGNVFSTFACGGGSTMGYKLAGYKVLGCVEIDKRMIDTYVRNHKPKYAYHEAIQKFKLRTDLPDELYRLDILDGSPPCSSFSMAGARERDWGKEKKFTEGQAEQVLDTLFFDYIDLAEKLQPKICVAENVEGILLGNAIEYVRRIYEAFDRAGYVVQHFVLNASAMGIPQKRIRVFFIALRKDLCEPFMHQVDMFTHLPKLDLSFNEPPITIEEVVRGTTTIERPLKKDQLKYWEQRQYGDTDYSDTILRYLGKKNQWFSWNYLYPENVCNTITSTDTNVLFNEPRHLNWDELRKVGTFPQDYDFGKQKQDYLIGMSVPPVMMAQVATRIYEQWLSKINS